MSGNFWLDTAALTVSLFSTILLLWLGIVVLASADRRSPGIWLAGGGLLCGGIFFLIHSAILGRGVIDLSADLDTLWHIGWLPIIVSPLAWYIVILWYAGFGLRAKDAALDVRIQQFGLIIAVASALLLVGLVLFANPLPVFAEIIENNGAALPSTAATPLFIAVYSLYNVWCIALALRALQTPEPSPRLMGDLARRRARPWLTAVSLILLLVSLLVAAFVAALYLDLLPFTRPGEELLALALFDLLIASLIALAVVLIGKAAVSYEIFTGKVLPRRGFFRQWRSAVILAAGFSVLGAMSLTLHVQPVYVLLLATLLLTTFFALFSARSYADRERYMEQLRPFVSSQQLYEHLLSSTAPTELDIATPFRALCENVLAARVAYLHALGPLAPLVGPAVTYPPNVTAPDNIDSIAAQFTSPGTLFGAVTSQEYNGAQWAIPLWSERGLIGALLLGEKRGGGLYTQEEFEIARASGERLIDTQASAELARRLIALQRQRLAESQLLDRRARRVLHDDILPQLHATILNLSSSPHDESVKQLTQLHRQIASLLREMPATAAPQVERRGLIGALQLAMDEELGSAFDGVEWDVEPVAEERARALPPLTAEVMYFAAREAIRNSARHGRGGDGGRPLHLEISARWRNGLEMGISDDGEGFRGPPIATEGNGRGLTLHGTLMAVVGGSLTIRRTSDTQTCVLLTLPPGAWQ